MMEFAAGRQLGRANLEVFSETLLSLAGENRNVLVVTSDSRGSGKLTRFAASLPDQMVEVGIAEQNLVGVAAGLASTGKIVFAVDAFVVLPLLSVKHGCKGCPQKDVCPWMKIKGGPDRR